MEIQVPDLAHALQGHDQGYLRIVAELWGISFDAADARSGLKLLVSALHDRALVSRVVNSLPEEARRALDDLAAQNGYMPWALFTRRYGMLRSMGPGRRDREKPYLQPVSTAEVLWYRALISRAFFDTPDGPQEFAFIPEDLMDWIPPAENAPRSALGRAASPLERKHLIASSDYILDHACTLLAALRLGMPLEALEKDAAGWGGGSPYALTPLILRDLLAAAGLLDEALMPRLEPVRAFLEAGRGEALAILVSGWLRSDTFNELFLLPGLEMEGEWRNQPLQTRLRVLDLLSTVPADSWWSIPAFTHAVYQSYPDFQRPAGDYDSWHIRDRERGEFLRGFEHWERVDGALLDYIIAGPLFWLGIVDLAAPAPGGPVSAFRFKAWANDLLKGTAPQGLAPENQAITATSDARLVVPRLAPRSLRYQLARFSQWEKADDEKYTYRLTPASLLKAHEQGLRLSHLVGLLRRYARTVPPSLYKALDRWEEHGSEASVESLVVLRLSSPKLLTELRKSRAARFLGDPLGPTAVIVQPGAWKKVLAILAELGYLGEARVLEEDDN
ncbi:MAG: hypothetical protein GX495_10340 [Chloroflexi bacterium]|nr:hypothetical protein [Chloroflexota bacterium]